MTGDPSSPMRTDTERLDWLEQYANGGALLGDDFGNWSLSFDGMQNIPNDPGTPSDISTSFYVEAKNWKPTIREAIDARMKAATETSGSPVITPQETQR